MSTKQNLTQVSFSDGIRDDEINENFDLLNNQLKRERLYVAGSGIMNGLSFSVDNFKLYVSNGSVIDLTGSEIFFSDISFNIALPKLIAKTETIKADSNGMIQLQNIPYASTGLCPSEYDFINSGVTAVDADNITRAIKLLNISGNSIYFDARVNANKNITVSYYYTFKRYDLVYIDNNYDIKILQGLSSSSPSVSLPAKVDDGNGNKIQGYKYILGYVLIDPMYVDNIVKHAYAKLIVTKEYKNLRNIYTDADNNLYIKGIPFDDLQLIHMERPVAPKENDIWYDVTYNKLKVFRTVDGISDWCTMNDTSIIPVMEYVMWTEEELDTASKLPAPDTHDLQTFLWTQKNDDGLKMKFVPGKNELDIIIDNTPLMHDQFTEIVDESSDIYENAGIGFKLVEPLDHAATIEARVVHRVWEDPVYVRFQRSATFIATDSFDYDPTNGLAVNTKVPYQYLENQLEVFVDGKKVDINKEYYEGTDLSSDKLIKGQMSSQFTFKDLSTTVNRISYTITTSVYSYDHLNDLLGDLSSRIQNVEDTVTDAVTSMQQMETTINTQVTNMQNDVNAVVQSEAEHADFIKKTDKLTSANMPDNINTWIPKAIINRTVQFLAANSSLNISLESSTSGMYSYMTDKITPQDYVQAFDISTSNGSTILKRKDGVNTNYDYDIVNISGVNYLSLTNNNIVQDGHYIYITGLSFTEVSE